LDHRQGQIEKSTGPFLFAHAGGLIKMGHLFSILAIIVLDLHRENRKYQPMETKLSQRMTAMGLTDKTLSERSGIDRSMITKMRLGKVSPSLKRAMVLCEITGLRPEDLIIKGADK
jgi:DNA-binding Xre family transcriptional regulator